MLNLLEKPALELVDRDLPINERLRKQRERHNLKANQIAAYLGMKAYRYRAYEARKDAHNFRMPSFSTLIKLAKLYNVSVEYFLGLEEEKPKNTK